MTSGEYKLNAEQLALFKLIQSRPYDGIIHPNMIPNMLGTPYISNIIYGHHYTPSVHQKAVDYLRNNYSTEPNDIFITSYPRCGTHWLLKITLEIIRLGSRHFDKLTREYQHSDIRFITLIEQLVSKPNGIKLLQQVLNRYNNDDNRDNYKILWSHAPYHLFPAKSIHPQTKILHIVRDPKDVCVSLYHLMKDLRKFYGSDISRNISLDDAVKLFINGCCGGGDYWESLIGWWLAYLDGTERNSNTRNQILFVFYEDIKNNPRKEIAKIIEFLGDKGGDKYLNVEYLLQENVLNEIVNNVTFKKQQKEAKKGYKFLFRKGIVGDWQRVLMKKHSDEIDRVTQMKFYQMKEIPYWKQESDSTILLKSKL